MSRDTKYTQAEWEWAKDKLVTSLYLTVEEAERRKAIAEMHLAEFAVDRQLDAKRPLTTDPRPVWHSRHGYVHPVAEVEAFQSAYPHYLGNPTNKRRIAVCFGDDIQEIDRQHPLKQVQTLATAVEAGDITRAEAATALGRDVAEVDAENARDRVRQLLVDEGVAAVCRQKIAENVSGEGIKPLIRTSINKGILALITRDFSAVSNLDVVIAENSLKADPSILRSLKASVEGLQAAYAERGHVL